MMCVLIVNWNDFLLPYEQAVSEIKAKLENMSKQYEMANKHSPIEMVESRVKSVGSILQKAEKKGVSLDAIAEKMEDIAGIRIICRFVEDIEKIVQMIYERENFDMTVLFERDYINNTKPSGYRSFHLIINYPVVGIYGKKELKVEIQIRTMSMDFWATIEHSLNYKYNGNIPEHVQKRLISSAEAAFQLDREMSSIRDEIMEAQKISGIVESAINEILANLQSLYAVAEMDKVNEMNREFLQIHPINDVNKLLAFKERLKVMVDVYKARYLI